jgi:hypothetical protein
VLDFLFPSATLCLASNDYLPLYSLLLFSFTIMDSVELRLDGGLQSEAALLLQRAIFKDNRGTKTKEIRKEEPHRNMMSVPTEGDYER